MQPVCELHSPTSAPSGLRTLGAVLVAVCLLNAGAGCGGGARDRVVPFAPDPVAEAKSIVQAYANGQSLGSEVQGFDDLLERVNRADAGKGGKLRSFLDEVRTKGKVDSAKAKKLLGEL